MLKLNLTRAPAWIDLAQGVRVKVEPVSSTLTIAAQAEVLRPGDEGADPSSRDATARALDYVAYVKAVGRRAITEWEGVMDEAGAALPVSDEAVDALFEQSIACYNAFARDYVNRGDAVVAEGNGSTPSPTGTSEEEPTTADPAPDDAKPARKSKADPKP